MNILLHDGLPEEYEGFPISADFRNMIQVDLIMNEEEAGEIEKTIASLHQLYPEIPSDMYKAIKGLKWFYSRGRTESGEYKDRDAEAKKESQKSFSFDKDANLIYSAFYATYGISLSSIEFLHWWEFMALFDGLPEDTLIKRVMYWRTADLKDVSKEERKYILKMRNLFSLKGPAKQRLSAEELDRRTKDKVARRFEEAQAALGSVDSVG